MGAVSAPAPVRLTALGLLGALVLYLTLPLAATLLFAVATRWTTTILPESLTLRGDEELLERAFENLVRNARDAAGRVGTVELGAWNESERVVVRVSDDGPGIPPERRQALRPFFTTRPGGLGLGLPIARKIVQLHEGRLDLLDRLPHGLEVRLSLPAAGPEQ